MGSEVLQKGDGRPWLRGLERRNKEEWGARVGQLSLALR